MELRILSAADVVRALPMAEAIAGMKLAFTQLSTGRATAPARSYIDVSAHRGISLVMPAYLAETGDLAVKIVSVFPENVKQHRPAIHGVVLILDPETGRPLALMDGGAVTAIRTGAASGAATDLLARADASVVAIFGSGVQARTQLEAVCTVRPIRSVRVYSPNREHAEAFAREMASYGPIPEDVTVASAPQAAVVEADIVCTATSAGTPVFDGRDLKPGAHVNAVGTFQTNKREVDTETVRRALVVVDSREAMWAEAGDLVIPIQAGDLTEAHVYAELGEIAGGQKAGRTSPEQVTFFKSVGIAVQDAVAGRIALQNAIARNLGTLVEL
ncbi:MAG: ornithine cyclodeaminase family protein [Chloroflexi bacterium]|nr:ornithine cyclodeaminase family protein [Chloroflexota bacterium]MCI0576736.1 ornithine cyclodeaminase family protein [Chloroflexota bacterium]MCI0646002.1 ornithine cyclodeaminase family protein [Chloroflexota bacterium]MCI0726849.1 ornithine cyclodeaminase family protein [Chloroflexota bacterium]